MDYTEEYIQKNPTLHLEEADLKARQILNFLKDTPVQIRSLLDIACGAGQITLRLASALNLPPKATTGLDISQTMITTAQALDQSGHANWVCADVFQYSPAQPADLVTCIDILEHIDNDLEFLQHIKHFGHYLLIKTPLEDSTINRWLTAAKLADPWAETREQYGHVHHYNESQLRRLWQAAGLMIVKDGYLPLPKRSKLHWELLRLITLPVGWFSPTARLRLVGGFKLVLLKTD